jgi:RpiB/LacA/LacB family sugar-phosphate isomerase
MKIYLGADHNGFHLKDTIFAYLSKRNHDVEDVSGKELDKNDDFPEFAQMAALKVIGDEDDDARAILLCGSGQGMAIAANRFRGIRATVIWDAVEAKIARNDIDSNIICLPARILENDDQEWKDIIDTWLDMPFANAPRFRRRNAQIDEVA